MAIEKVNLLGATIVATANNGANSTITMQCLKGDIDISMGEYGMDEDICHTVGREYVKSQIPSFKAIELDTWFTGDKADTERIFWLDALGNLVDFTQANGDQSLSLAITLADTSANIITFNAIVTKGVLGMKIEKDSHLMVTMQQTSVPVLT